MGKESVGAATGKELGLGQRPVRGASAGGAPCPLSALTPAPLRAILSPTSPSSCLTAHSDSLQQFQQEREEACIQLKPQGGFREAEGNFPSWNMARIRGLISWLLGKQSWDLCSLRVILISVLSQIWKKKKKKMRQRFSRCQGFRALLKSACTTGKRFLGRAAQHLRHKGLAAAPQR